MKKRYIGFLPAIVILLYSHYTVILYLIESNKHPDKLIIAPFGVIVVFMFWGIISILGILWALDI